MKIFIAARVDKLFQIAGFGTTLGSYITFLPTLAIGNL